MSHVADFFTNTVGTGYSFVLTLIFLVMSVFGLVVAFRGKLVMVWLVAISAFVVGAIGGAMIGLFVFNSLIITIIMGIVCGIFLSLLVKFVKGIGYFIGISALGFFISYVVTSEMYITNTKITEDMLLALDMIIGLILGILSLFRSRYVTIFVTAVSGGMLASIGLLASFGYYFSDWKMWLLSITISGGGMFYQIKKSAVPAKNKHSKTKKK